MVAIRRQAASPASGQRPLASAALVLLLVGAVFAVATSGPGEPSPDEAPSAVLVQADSGRWLVQPTGASAWHLDATMAGEAAWLDQLARIAPGVEVLHRYTLMPTWLLDADAHQIERLLDAGVIAHAHADEDVTLHLDRSRLFSRFAPATAASPGTPINVPFSVAVIDTGVDQTHPALSDHIRATVTVTEEGDIPTSVDEDGHGTHVASIIGGGGEESPDGRYQGLATGVPVVVVDLADSFSVSGVLRAFDWIAANHEAHRIRIVSASIGRTTATDAYDPDDPWVKGTRALYDRGILVVQSAGNKGPDVGTMANEAMAPHVLTVGAVDISGARAAFSSLPGASFPGVKPDVYALGIEIVAARAASADTIDAQVTVGQGYGRENGYYVSKQGTSQAAPQVSAAVARLLAEHPGLSIDEVIERIRDTAVVSLVDDTVRILDVPRLVAGYTSAGPSDAAYDFETTVPVSGRTLGVGGLFGLSTPMTQADPFEVTFPVSGWADSVTVQIAYDTGGFEATLRGPAGETARLSDADPATTVRSPVSQGLWRLHVEPEPSGAAGSGFGAVTVLATVAEQRVGAGPLQAAADGVPETVADSPFVPSIVSLLVVLGLPAMARRR